MNQSGRGEKRRDVRNASGRRDESGGGWRREEGGGALGGFGLVGTHLCVRWQCAAACARPGRAASPPPPGPPVVASCSSSPSSAAFG